MFVLLREISPYTSAQLFLGLFSEIEQAESACDAYLEAVALDDPWEKQAYRIAQLPDDMKIVPVEDFRARKDGDEVLLLVGVLDEQGQILHRYEGVFSLAERPEAEAYAAKLEAGPWQTAPNWCELKQVRVNLREPPPPAPAWLLAANK